MGWMVGTPRRRCRIASRNRASERGDVSRKQSMTLLTRCTALYVGLASDKVNKLQRNVAARSSSILLLDPPTAQPFIHHPRRIETWHKTTPSNGSSGPVDGTMRPPWDCTSTPAWAPAPSRFGTSRHVPHRSAPSRDLIMHRHTGRYHPFQRPLPSPPLSGTLGPAYTPLERRLEGPRRFGRLDGIDLVYDVGRCAG